MEYRDGGGQIGAGRKGLEGFVGEEKDFVWNAEPDQEPVKVHEGGSDVLPGFGVGQNPGNWVLHILEPVQGFAGYSGQDCRPEVMKV